MRPALLIAVSAALSLAACGKKDSTPGADASPAAADSATPGMAGPGMASPGMNAPVAVTVSPAQAFANDAAASDMFEIESSRLAAEKAQSAGINRFADSMIKAHTESTAKLKAAAAAASPAITPDPMLTTEQQQTLSDLGGKSGADFDQAYAAAQATAHQMTLEKLKAYAATGEVASLKDFARKMVPAVTGHLNMAKSLK